LHIFFCFACLLQFHFSPYFFDRRVNMSDTSFHFFSCVEIANVLSGSDNKRFIAWVSDLNPRWGVSNTMRHKACGQKLVWRNKPKSARDSV
jgi:hypothetical protein